MELINRSRYGSSHARTASIIETKACTCRIITMGVTKCFRRKINWKIERTVFLWLTYLVRRDVASSYWEQCIRSTASTEQEFTRLGRQKITRFGLAKWFFFPYRDLSAFKLWHAWLQWIYIYIYIYIYICTYKIVALRNVVINMSSCVRLHCC
jgi:hypothetical protein